MRLPLLALLFFLPSLSRAHGLHDAGGGLIAGLLHPLLGLDHMLAALAVGLWAGTATGWLRLLLPLGFTLAMLLAATLAHGEPILPWIEPGIAVSLLALGFLLLLRLRPHPFLAMPLMVLLAGAHGLAHGAEGASIAFLPYLVGLGITTLSLHLTGLALTRGLAEPIHRLSGAGIIGVGLWALG